MTTWNFIDDDGTFVLQAPHRTSALYFPLVNEAGMMSAVTPLLNGDSKTGQNAFLTLPVSVEDLHNTRSARNFWVAVDGAAPWSATGNSAPQVAQTFDEDTGETVTLEAGLLWHKVTRENRQMGVRAEMTSIVPPGDDCVELMQVTLTNHRRPAAGDHAYRGDPDLRPLGRRPARPPSRDVACCIASARSSTACWCARRSPLTSAATGPTRSRTLFWAPKATARLPLRSFR